MITRLLGAAACFAVAIGPAWAGGLYDGTYHGQLTGLPNNALNCAKQAPVQITVANDQLTYVHMGNAIIIAQVGTDGAFKGRGENKFVGGGRMAGPNIQTLEGKIAGGGITARTDVGNSCSYTLALKKFG